MSDVSNTSLLSDDFSNFRALGIGKPTAKQQVNKAKRVEKRAAAKTERQGMKKGGKILNIINKANPLTATARAGFLAILRLNVFGLSRRLYPAVVPEKDWKAKHINAANAKRAKETLEKKIIPFWQKVGGRSVSLTENIRKGFDKPLFNTKKMKAAKAAMAKSSFDGTGYEDILSQVYLTRPVVADSEYENPKTIDDLWDDEFSCVSGADDVVLVTAGLTLAGSVVKMINDSNVAKNPFEPGSPEFTKTETENKEAESIPDPPPPPATDQEIADMEDAADTENFLGIPKPGGYIVWSLIGAGAIYGLYRIFK